MSPTEKVPSHIITWRQNRSIFHRVMLIFVL